MTDDNELAARDITVKVYAQVFNYASGAMQLFEFDAGEVELNIDDSTNIDTLTVRGHLSRHERYEEKPV